MSIPTAQQTRPWNRLEVAVPGAKMTQREAPVDYREWYSTQAEQTIETLRGFADLEQDWDSYGAEAPTAATIRQAELAVGAFDAHQVSIDHVAPNAGGYIDLVLTPKTKEIEISISDAEWQIATEDADGLEVVLVLPANPRNVNRVLELAL